MWCDPERDSDLQDREVAFFIRKSGVSKHFFGNGLKLKLAIVWIDPEQDSDLRDREVAYSRVGGLFCSVLTMITFDN